MKSAMGKSAPSLSNETWKEYLPEQYEELTRQGVVGRPIERVVFGKICTKSKSAFRKGSCTKDLAGSILRLHVASMDPLAKLILLEEGIEGYVEKYKERPTKEDENEIRELLGLGPAIGSA